MISTQRSFNWNSTSLVSVYDELPLWSAMFGQLLLEHVPLKPNLQVLDVGCGTGFPLLELAQRLGDSCSAVGLDPWQTALRRAQCKIETFSIVHACLTCGFVEALPFCDDTFDIIVSNLGINNFNSPITAMRECARVARTSATLVMTSNLRGHMREFYEVYTATLEELGLADIVPLLAQHIEHRMSLDEISLLFAQSGFTMVKLRQETQSMRFLDGGALLGHAFIQLGFVDAWRSIIPIDKQEQVFRALKRNLDRHAQPFGELRLSIPSVCVIARKDASTLW